jgi:DNA mismatch endonuclease (patch repair protein)
MERTLREKLEGGSFGEVSEVHSKRMGAIRGRGNKSTEAKLRAMLVRAGVRGWKLHPKTILGRPDFYFPAGHLAIFVDGCFWHGCPECGHVPGKNRAFWQAKIECNQRRDRETDAKLAEQGTTSLRFWEHELKRAPRECMGRVLAALKQVDEVARPTRQPASS